MILEEGYPLSMPKTDGFFHSKSCSVKGKIVTMVLVARFEMMNHFLFRRQDLNWEYLLSIPSLLVRLLVTVASCVHDGTVVRIRIHNCFCDNGVVDYDQLILMIEDSGE